jgi:hypothetical protein
LRIGLITEIPGEPGSWEPLARTGSLQNMSTPMINPTTMMIRFRMASKTDSAQAARICPAVPESGLFSPADGKAKVVDRIAGKLAFLIE